MLKGELSNEVPSRVLVVFENLLGLLPDTKTRALEKLARKRKKWEQAASYYQLNVPTSRGIRDLYRRHHYRVDVITFTDPLFVPAIRNRLDSRNLLFGDVHYYSQEELLSELTYDPWILSVLDPDPSHVLTYGSKGRYTTPEDLNLMGLII
jgi:hypothetical protein